MRLRHALSFCALVTWAPFLFGCVARQESATAALSAEEPKTNIVNAAVPGKRFVLHAADYWQLNLLDRQQFDASGLLWARTNRLLTVNDRGSSLYQVQFLDTPHIANLMRLENVFTSGQLSRFSAQKLGRYDGEGIAQDSEGRLYLCEEGNRWILRQDPKTGTVERLDIDWAPVQKYFHPTDRNASFEGIAVGGERLYVANERTRGRIIVVDLKTLKVIDDFLVQPADSNARDVHYSDLSWFDGFLYVLLRNSLCVLKVTPETHHVVAEYDFSALEELAETRYLKLYPTGNMEGLAVTADSIWLVTDNNGLGRVRHPSDIRPTLFRCTKPD